jgi:hypothetical protein
MAAARKAVDAQFEKLQNSWNSWQDINASSQSLVLQIINNTHQLTYAEGHKWGALVGVSNMKEQVTNKLEASLREKNSKLQEHYNKLSDIVLRMRDVVTALQNVSNETFNDLGAPYVFEEPLYGTCPLSNYVKWAEEIVTMVQKELMLKYSITQDLKTCAQRETLLVYASAWLMQPYMDEVRYGSIIESLQAEYASND